MEQTVIEQPDVDTVVAIAASAGGLEATSLLVQNLPPELNCCYVIAQHMSPSHKSMLVQLLSRETRLTVSELDATTTPKPNVIYIPPPAHDVIFRDGNFQLREPAGHPASPKPSADRLFSSLAETVGVNAIGVVLSGTGSDGSYGIRSIREHGGITIAQEPNSSKYDSMPVAAIRTGCIDLTLTPQQIGKHIGLVMERPRDLSALKELNEQTTRNRDLFEILLANTLVDFRQYKETTINRRIQRRMIAKGINDFDEYVDLCRRSVEEVLALYRDLLISVTRFFRDPEQFKTLAKALNESVPKHPKEKPFRVWVSGCATGEEAYTIAILVAEAMGGPEVVGHDQIQIFATDIDEDALAVGRKGIYPQAAIADIPPDLLPKYFDIKDDSICVKAKLRSFVMFSRHNVFQDPPFISDDLISIRNVLIYFSTKLQERVLTRMVYALNPGGHLLLGTSETLGHMESQFSQVSPESRLYRLDSNKIALRDREAAYIGQSPTLVPRGEAGKSSQAASVDEWKRFDRLAQSVAPISLLMNRERMVLRIYGDVGPYCSITAQSFGNSNISILKKPLASDAASLALVALKHDERRQGQWHQVPGGDGKVVQLTAYPMQADADLNADIVLIGFETKDEPEPATTEQEKTDYVHYLEDELARTRDALQVTIEQLQTSNEELQAVNEELQSSNEELQSTNEELETSNEELQSTNEELITVNEELLVNTSQLERTSAELGAIVQNTPTMLLMIDQGLLIRYASERAKQVFSLGERGTGYGHLSQAMIPHGYPRIVDMCSQVLTSREPITHRFQTGLRLNELAIAPISGLDGQMIGLVLQIQSVDSEDGLSLLSERLREIAEIGTWRYNTATNKVSISRHLAEIIGTEVETLESSFDKILEFCRDEDRDRVQKILNDATEKLEKFDYFVSMNRPDGTSFLGRNIGEAFRDHETGNIILAGNFRNISDELNKNFLIKHYERVFGEHGIGFYSYDVRHNLPFWSPTFFDILGYDRDTVPSMELGLDVFSGEARKRVESSVQQAMQTGAPFDYTEEMTRKNGSRASVRGLGDVAKDETGAVTHVFGSIQVLEELP